MPRFTLTIDEADLKNIVKAYVKERFGGTISVESMQFKVKSKNNFRPQEWEDGRFQMQIDEQIEG